MLLQSHRKEKGGKAMNTKRMYAGRWPICPKCRQDMIVGGDGFVHCYEHGPFRNGKEGQDGAKPLEIHVSEAMGSKTRVG